MNPQVPLVEKELPNSKSPPGPLPRIWYHPSMVTRRRASSDPYAVIEVVESRSCTAHSTKPSTSASPAGLRRSGSQPACSTSPNVEITPTSSHVRGACASTRPFSEVQDDKPRRPATITNRGTEERYSKGALLRRSCRRQKRRGWDSQPRGRVAAPKVSRGREAPEAQPWVRITASQGPGVARQRRGWDSNPRGKNPPVFKTGAISRSATPPSPQDRNPLRPLQRRMMPGCPCEVTQRRRGGACARAE